MHATRKGCFFEYDGGNEFFSFDTYDRIMSVIDSLIDLHGFDLTQMPDAASLKMIDPVKSDDLECIVNALTNKIRNKRLEYNITQEQLSKVTGLSVRTIRHMESSNASMSLNNFIKVLKALDLDYILSEFEVDLPLRQRAPRLHL